MGSKTRLGRQFDITRRHKNWSSFLGLDELNDRIKLTWNLRNGLDYHSFISLFGMDFFSSFFSFLSWSCNFFFYLLCVWPSTHLLFIVTHHMRNDNGNRFSFKNFNFHEIQRQADDDNPESFLLFGITTTKTIDICQWYSMVVVDVRFCFYLSSLSKILFGSD